MTSHSGVSYAGKDGRASSEPGCWLLPSGPGPAPHGGRVVNDNDEITSQPSCDGNACARGTRAEHTC